MINYLRPILIFIPLVIIQLVIIPLISVFGIIPQLIMVLLVYYTLISGQIYGMLLGALFGFLFDLFSGGVLGSSMLSMTIAGFVTGYFYYDNRIEENTTTFYFVIILFIASFIQSFLSSEIGNFNPEISFWVVLLEGSLFPALFTSAFGVIFMVFQARKKRL